MKETTFENCSVILFVITATGYMIAGIIAGIMNLGFALMFMSLVLGVLHGILACLVEIIYKMEKIIKQKG